MGISPAIIIVDPIIRKQISDVYEKFGLNIVVLSHAEIDKNVNFEVMGRIALNQAEAMENNDMFG